MAPVFSIVLAKLIVYLTFLNAHYAPIIYASNLNSTSTIPIQTLPTYNNPFVFLHMEKCAGTTMREYIVESAIRNGLNYYVPCYNRLLCELFSLEHDHVRWHLDNESVLLDQKQNLSKISVIGGHFSWNVWLQLPVFQYKSLQQKTKSLSALKNASFETLISEANGNQVNKIEVGGAASANFEVEIQPSCFAVVRHPVDRVISYYYQRCYRNSDCITYNKPFNSLTITELDLLLLRLRGYSETVLPNIFIDDGMTEVYCRTFTNTKITTGEIFNHTIVKKRLYQGSNMYPSHITLPEAIDIAKQRINHCVIGILDKWQDTIKVLSHWFPWIEISDQLISNNVFANPRKRMKTNIANKETRNTISKTLLDRIILHNPCDMELYEYMLRRFDIQIKVIN